jgi:hypothetical protein
LIESANRMSEIFRFGKRKRIKINIQNNIVF